MTAENKWKNGIYKSSENHQMLMKVEGNHATMFPHVYLDFPDIPSTMVATWTFGDFGPARKEVQDAANGVENYNMKMELGVFFSAMGILSEDGERIYSWGMFDSLDVVQWLDDEALKELKDSRESVEAPSCSYKIQPENQGKLVWLSGPPGAGKSTTGQLLAKENDFVYYEADCQMAFLNPFVPVNVDNPTKAAFQQPRLKGLSKEAIDANLETGKLFEQMNTGQVDFSTLDMTRMKPFYESMAKDVGHQKKRIGGDFAVAQAVTNRMFRDHIRQFIPDVIFVILNLTKETQRKRIIGRHGDGEASQGLIKLMSDFFDLYDLPGEDEDNTYVVNILEDMTPSDVREKVLQVLKDNGK